MRAEAQDVARKLAEALVDRHGATRVWLFGSAAGEWVFHDYSDIDLAVEGLDFDTFLRVKTELEEMAKSRFLLDLRPCDMFSEEDWADLIPEPVLLAERKDASGHRPDQR